MEEFTSIHFEVFISPDWVDLTPDVKVDPPPKWNRGIMGNTVLDRVGDAGQLTFSLRNDADNSAGKIGYYSPGHANAMTGWGTGLLVRLYFVFEGRDYYKFRGVIEPGGLEVDAGVLGDRTVKVSVHDFMAQMSDHELKLLTYREDYTLEEVANKIILKMPIEPHTKDYGTGSSTFPFVFDTATPSTRAIAELYKATMSEWGFAYERGDKVSGSRFVTEGRTERTNTDNNDLIVTTNEASYYLREDGDNWLREDSGAWLRDEIQEAAFNNSGLVGGTKTSYGTHLVNRVEGVSHPRRVDAAATTVLAELQKSFKLIPGETKENYRMHYVDPDQNAARVTGKDMVTPVATTHYTAYENEDGSGVNYTADLSVTASFGVADVEYKLEHTGATEYWVQKLNAVGRGIYIYEPVSVVYEDTDSQAKHGIHTLRIDMPYQDDPTVVDTFSQLTLENGKDPYTSFDSISLFANKDGMNMQGFLSLEPGTRAAFKDDMNAIDGSFYIMGYDAQIVSGKYVVWSPVLRNTGLTTFAAWILGTSILETDTILGIPT